MRYPDPKTAAGDDEDRHYVYVIGTVSEDALIAPVKVGVTNDLQQRVATIQTSCPHPIELLHAIALPRRVEALGLERSFHLTQEARRTSGEWFDIPPLKAVKLLLLEYVMNFATDQSLGATAWARYGLTLHVNGDELSSRIITLLDEA